METHSQNVKEWKPEISQQNLDSLRRIGELASSHHVPLAYCNTPIFEGLYKNPDFSRFYQAIDEETIMVTSLPSVKIRPNPATGQAQLDERSIYLISLPSRAVTFVGTMQAHGSCQPLAGNRDFVVWSNEMSPSAGEGSLIVYDRASALVSEVKIGQPSQDFEFTRNGLLGLGNNGINSLIDLKALHVGFALPYRRLILPPCKVNFKIMGVKWGVFFE